MPCVFYIWIGTIKRKKSAKNKAEPECERVYFAHYALSFFYSLFMSFLFSSLPLPLTFYYVMSNINRFIFIFNNFKFVSVSYVMFCLILVVAL